MATIYDWSTTAGNNATADANINWSEGMFPSAVNDSARQMMRRQAEWLKDNGLLPTLGINTITVTTNAQVTAPIDGMSLVFKPSSTNTAAVTISMNGGAGNPIKKVKFGGAEAVDLDAGDIQKNGAYVIRFDANANAGAGAWVLLNKNTLSLSDTTTFSRTILGNTSGAQMWTTMGGVAETGRIVFPSGKIEMMGTLSSPPEGYGIAVLPTAFPNNLVGVSVSLANPTASNYARMITAYPYNRFAFNIVTQAIQNGGALQYDGNIPFTFRAWGN